MLRVSIEPQGIQGPAGTISGYAYGVNNVTAFSVPSSGVVPFNQTDFPAFGISISISTITLQQPGIYMIDYMVRGTPADPNIPLEFILTSNGSTPVPGSWVRADKEVTGSNPVNLSCSCIFFTSSSGTILSLANNSSAAALLASTGQNNASIRIVRLA